MCQRHLVFCAAILSFAIALFPSSAVAFDPYIRLSLGGAQSTDSDFADVDCRRSNPAALFGCGNGPDGNPIGAYGDFDTAPIIEGAIGLQFNIWLRGELALSHLWHVDYDGQANFRGVAIGQQPVSGTARSTAFLANAYVDLVPLFTGTQGKFSPYVSVGLGASHNHIGSMDYEFPTLGDQDKTIVPSGTRTDFAWTIGFGVSYAIRKNLTADLGYRFIDRGRLETSAGHITVVRSGSPDRFIPIDRTRADFRTNEISLGLRYAF